jgi:hypothetical protein
LKSSFFALLGLCFPRADVKFSQFGAEYHDLNGNFIGYVPNKEIFVLLSEYENYQSAKQALEEHGIHYTERDNAEIVYK